MDGGQKIDINLESPLDTKSSDMLVSVNDIKFAHNRQKFQGHVLPTSLRYERNGWAAGWYVYDFTIGGGYIFSRSRYTSLGGVAYGGVAQYLAATRTKINNAPTYAITLRVAEDNNPDNVDAIQNRPFAVLYYTQAQTIEARECKEATIDFGDVNPLCPKIHIDYAVNGVSYPQDFVFEFDVCSDDTPEFSIDGTDNKLRLSYMYENYTCTVIDIDEMNRLVRIRNYTNNIMMRAFGMNTEPTFEDYEEFLESRCFPRTGIR